MNPVTVFVWPNLLIVDSAIAAVFHTLNKDLFLICHEGKRETRLGALFTDEAERSPQQVAAVAFADTLVAELLAADTLIITLPMYNFSIPSMLKAWVDHIARAGVTFQYTDTGPVGLLEGKKVYLVSALGGKHAAGGTDFMRPYMQLLMNFIGISDVHFVSAEGLSMGEEARSAGLSEARAQIASL